LVEDGEYKGVYVADTGNDCVRFISPEGHVTTLSLKIPDVRLMANNCEGGSCKFEI
jgi:hypothetical protein